MREGSPRSPTRRRGTAGRRRSSAVRGGQRETRGREFALLSGESGIVPAGVLVPVIGEPRRARSPDDQAQADPHGDAVGERRPGVGAGEQQRIRRCRRALRRGECRMHDEVSSVRSDARDRRAESRCVSAGMVVPQHDRGGRWRETGDAPSRRSPHGCRPGTGRLLPGRLSRRCERGRARTRRRSGSPMQRFLLLGILRTARRAACCRLRSCA